MKKKPPAPLIQRRHTHTPHKTRTRPLHPPHITSPRMLRSAVAAHARRHLSAASSSSSAGGHPTRIAELVRARGADASDAPALVVPAANVRWTYGELVDRIHCFANGLNEMGYAPGQRLGVRLDNSAELLVTLMGSALSGEGKKKRVPEGKGKGFMQ